MRKVLFFLLATALASTTVIVNSSAAPNQNSNGNPKFWGQTQISQAIPRDLVIDERGLAYLKGKSGDFIPHGHATPFASAQGKGRTKLPSPTPTPTPNLPTITNAQWTQGGNVQTSAGRLYFYMPNSTSKLSDINTWGTYVCSGTVVTDTRTDQSLILTAAHCIYDDVNKVFAARVMFIPNQAASGTATDRNCANDIIGCWFASYGVVDNDWASRTFPANAAWDYGYYVVNNSGSHLGNGGDSNLVLDSAVGNLMPITFATNIQLLYSYAFGYSYNQDPKFMYCAQKLSTTSSVVPSGQWWLSQCGLTGGSSGGPWMQSSGVGPIMSINSWGYSGSPGMAGPLLGATSAKCLMFAAEDLSTSPKQGGFLPNNC